LDTTGRSHYLGEVLYNGLVNDFAFDYADKQRAKLKETYPTVESFDKDFSISPILFQDFVKYAEKNGVKPVEKQVKISEPLLKLQLKALIARNIWNNSGFYPILQKDDNVLNKALELLK
jgi:carboxyl-terminal processing protease